MKRFLLLGFISALLFGLIGAALADCPTSITQTFTVGGNQQTFTLTQDDYYFNSTTTTVCYHLTSNPAGTNLSHFVIAMCDDITSGRYTVTYNGVDITDNAVVGPDPTTGVDGIKLENVDDGEYCFTFTNGPDGPWALDCTTAALKQGHATAPLQQAIKGLDCSHVHFPESTIGGIKYYDTNANSHFDAGEPVLAGWHIQVKIGNNDPFVVLTDSTGTWAATGQPGTTYSISEVFANETCWHQTAPIGNLYTGTFQSGTTIGLDFGNVCTGPGGGLTLGFWSNKNGQALETTGDFTTLTGLNLRNAAGADRDFIGTLSQNKSALNSWLLNATATNMAYMLSAQLAAMELNVAHGVNSLQLVYAPGTQSANLAGFATIGDLMNEANNSLGTNNITIAAGPTRTYQELLKTILDGLNNGSTSGGYVQPTPCPYTFP